VALSCLWCLPPSQRFIIHEQRQQPAMTSLRGSIAPASGAAVLLKSYLPLEEVEHRYLQVQSRLSLGSRSQSVGLSTDLDLVRALCDEGNFVDALNLAIHSKLPSNEANSALGAAVASFSSQCSALSSSSSPSSALPSVQLLEEQFLSSLGCVPHPLLLVDQPAPRYLWQYLLNALHLLDDPKTGWLLHQIGTQSALSLSLLRENRIPAILSASFCGLDSFSSHASSKKRSREAVPEKTLSVSAKRSRGHLDSLLRTLLAQGCLVDACDVVSTFLAETLSPPPPLHCLPLTALDQLLFACQTALRLAADEEDQTSVAVLRDRYDRLRTEVSSSFAELFQREITAK
jgi:hypothetical protein